MTRPITGTEEIAAFRARQGWQAAGRPPLAGGTRGNGRRPLPDALRATPA
jgi:hypothetical protein